MSGLAVVGEMDVAAALGTVIGEDAALRVARGSATVCDVVLVAMSLGIDSVQAVVDYADAALGLVSRSGESDRCA